MSLKMKQIIKNLFKISILSLIFLLWFLFLNKSTTINNNIEIKTETKIKTTPNNNANYKNVVISPIANVWVALTSNIWIWWNKTNSIKETNINNKIYKVEDFYLNTESLKNELLKSNIIFTQEYLNIIRMDFNWIIKKSKNKEQTLNNIIKQLEIRFQNANTNSINLNNQNTILIQEYDKITLEIEELKKWLDIDFAHSDSKKVFTHIDNYYILKNNQTILKTNIIFINEFIKRYNYLNNYNKLLLDTLINNKDIITKDSFIVIPDSWDQLLRSFDLIFTEEEYKQK